MKLLKYLDENSSLDELDQFIDNINKNCKPFLKDFKFDVPLYRGIESKIEYEHIKTNKDRKPLNLSPALHKKYGSIFKKKFGVDLRSEGVFCSLDGSQAAGYGNIYLVFPAGEYKFFYSRYISDLLLFTDLDIFESKDVDFVKTQLYFKWIKGEVLNKREFYNLCEEVSGLLDSKYSLTSIGFLGKTKFEIFYKEYIENEILTDSKKWEKYFVDLYKEGNYKSNDLGKNEIMVTCNDYYIIKSSFFRKKEVYFRDKILLG